MNNKKITEKINDETPVTVSPRWVVEIILSIWRVKAFNPRRNQTTGIRIGITKIENSREVKVNRVGKMQGEERNEGEYGENTGLGSHGQSLERFVDVSWVVSDLKS